MPDSKSILIVDDDPHICRLLAAYFVKDGFSVQTVSALPEARQLLSTKIFDVVLIDINLVSENGLDLVGELRQVRKQLGVIIISSNDDVTDRIIGLEMGADDYITKPLDPRELLIRVRRLLERLKGTIRDTPLSKNNLEFRDLIIDQNERVAFDSRGSIIGLTSKEFEMLQLLSSNAGKTLSRDQISCAIQGRSWSAGDRALDMLINRLRIKLEDSGITDCIMSVRGLGYVFTLAKDSQKFV